MLKLIKTGFRYTFYQAVNPILNDGICSIVWCMNMQSLPVYKLKWDVNSDPIIAIVPRYFWNKFPYNQPTLREIRRWLLWSKTYIHFKNILIFQGQNFRPPPQRPNFYYLFVLSQHEIYRTLRTTQSINHSI